jgi:hypothetical protein
LPPTATPAPTAAPASWFQDGVVALFSVGDYSSGDLYALQSDGSTRLILSGIGSKVRLSPGGRWLGSVWQDGSETLELRDAESGASRLFTPSVYSGMLDFAFDGASRRLAYLDLGAPSESGVPWALVIVDLENNASARYEALLSNEDRTYLPGIPVGWTGFDDEQLILDAFMPYTEGGNAGAWSVTLPPDGASAPLDTLPLRKLPPGEHTYLSRLYLSPDGQNLAFLSRDYEYMPENYLAEFYDLAVNRLEIAALGDGARALLVEASDGSALGNLLAWSPAGDRLLFAQGRYEGQDFSTLTLKSSDLGGAVTEHGALSLSPSSALADLAWCSASQALYVLSDWSANEQRLYSLDLLTGVSTELTTGPQIQLAGCAP